MDNFKRIVLHDEYFIERTLYPNVDFYSGIIYKAMGFPASMFLVLFAIASTSCWLARWQKMPEDPEQKIERPGQIYTGTEQREYIQIEKRTQGIEPCRYVWSVLE